MAGDPVVARRRRDRWLWGYAVAFLVVGLVSVLAGWGGPAGLCLGLSAWCAGDASGLPYRAL